MSFALKVAGTGKVALVCKSSLDEANTDLAQGGVASVTNFELDNFEKHIHDTMVAGDWLSDPKAVEQVVTQAPEQIKALIDWGVDFDKDKVQLIYCLVSLYATFILNEPIHSLDTPFPGNLKIKKLGKFYYCPVKATQKNTEGAVCNICISREIDYDPKLNASS